MKRIVAVVIVLATSAVSLLLGVGLPSLAADQSYVIHSDVRLVLLDVSVRNRAGAFVSGLPQDAFSVYEDGRAQQIKVFADHDAPVTMGVVVDASYSMRPKRDEVLKAADLLIRESNPRDEVAVLDFNEKLRWGLPRGVLFSSDPEQLRKALYRGRPDGKTAIYDAVIAGLERLREGSRDRRTLVVISDGRDNASEHSRQDLLRQIEESSATIYTIGIYERGSEDQDPVLLRKLAGISGGEAYFPATLDQMDGICSRIAKDIRQRYTVGYTPVEAPAGSSGLRQIHLRVKGPGNTRLIAKARTSYLYDHQTAAAAGPEAQSAAAPPSQK